VDREIEGWMCRLMAGRTDGWVGEWMDRLTDEWMES
jgi:hypothetical protein